MNEIRKVLFLSVLCITIINGSLFAMEPEIVPVRSQITIVDCNTGNSVKKAIGQESIIGVFGATLCYSAFERYMKTLRADYASLLMDYAKNAKLKGIDRSVRSFLSCMNECLGLEEFTGHITKTSEQELYRLFFAGGFEIDTLKQNFKVLLNTLKYAYEKVKKGSAHGEHAECTHLVHLLMPCYFSDLKDLKDNPKTSSLIYCYLQEVASFYKKLYEETISDKSLNIACDSLKVSIVIPPMEHFVAIIQSGGSLSKLGSITSVLKDELIAQIGPGSTYLIMNQDDSEHEPILNFFKQQCVKNVHAVAMPLTNKRGMPTTIFNPYILKADEKSKHTYKNSPLFNEQLLEYVKKEIKAKEEIHE